MAVNMVLLGHQTPSPEHIACSLDLPNLNQIDNNINGFLAYILYLNCSSDKNMFTYEPVSHQCCIFFDPLLDVVGPEPSSWSLSTTFWQFAILKHL